MEIACRLDSLCVTLGDQWSLVTVNVLPALVRDADHDVRCEVSFPCDVVCDSWGSVRTISMNDMLRSGD